MTVVSPYNNINIATVLDVCTAHLVQSLPLITKKLQSITFLKISALRYIFEFLLAI